MPQWRFLSVYFEKDKREQQQLLNPQLESDTTETNNLKINDPL